jgi:hypothetical protein
MILWRDLTQAIRGQSSFPLEVSVFVEVDVIEQKSAVRETSSGIFVVLDVRVQEVNEWHRFTVC